MYASQYTCMSYEEEDSCMSYEEEDSCMQVDTCGLFRTRDASPR